MSAHTPGPWLVWDAAKDGGGVGHTDWPHVMTHDGLAVCDLCDWGSLNFKEQTANARLIAAAPMLLEALQAAVECGMVPTSSAANGGASAYGKHVQVADQIRAAIACAMGAA